MANNAFSEKDLLGYIDAFDGKDVSKLDTFINQVNIALNLLAEDRRSNFIDIIIGFKITGDALERVRTFEFDTWDELVLKLTQNFKQVTKSIPTLINEISNCKQRSNENIDAYASRIKSLRTQFLRIAERGDQTIETICVNGFKRGLLNFKIQNALLGCEANDLSSVIERAVNIESEIGLTQGGRINYFNKLNCNICGRNNHSTNQCRFQRNHIKCEICNRNNHQTHQCRFNRNHQSFTQSINYGQGPGNQDNYGNRQNTFRPHNNFSQSNNNNYQRNYQTVGQNNNQGSNQRNLQNTSNNRINRLTNPGNESSPTVQVSSENNQ